MKRISGSWLDFVHPLDAETQYWRETSRAFTCDQWRGKVAEMRSMGCDTIVVMAVSMDDKAVYHSSVVSGRWAMGCADPVRAVLDGAKEAGVGVYVGIGFYQHVGVGAYPDDPYFGPWHFELADELSHRYGDHPALAGWYYSTEARILNGAFDDGYIAFWRDLGAHLQTLTPDKRTLIAPVCIYNVAENERFVEQLRSMQVSHIAYQDTVGQARITVEQIPEMFGRLKRLHDAAGVPLWTDLELFVWEGQPYASPLMAGPIERIARQVEAETPYVEKILAYQLFALYNPPGSAQFCGHADSMAKYVEFMRWVEATEFDE